MKISCNIAAIALLGAIGGCSVGMAARTGGIKVEDVTACGDRACFLAQDKMEILQTVAADDGGTLETYKFQLKRGSAGRAAMHGLLDVATLGVWEVAGTPIEASQRKKYIVLTAHYDKSGKLVSKILGDVAAYEAKAANPAIETQETGRTPVYANGELVGYLESDGSLTPLLKSNETSQPVE